MTRRLNLVIAGLAVALLCTVIARPLLQKQELLGMLEPQLIEAADLARQTRKLRSEVAELIAGSRYLVDKKRRAPSAIGTINELAKLLPDHTWVHRLHIDETGIQLQGQSASPATLIELLESSSLFENVRFRSPLTRQANSDEERFHLSADLEPPPPQPGKEVPDD